MNSNLDFLVLMKKARDHMEENNYSYTSVTCYRQSGISTSMSDDLVSILLSRKSSMFSQTDPAINFPAPESNTFLTSM